MQSENTIGPLRASPWTRIAIGLLVLIFFQVGYKWGYRFHEGPGVINGATSIDRALPLVPEFIVFYMLGYLFVLVPCFAVKERRAFQAAIVAFCLMMAVAFVMFRYLPIQMEKTYATGGDWFSRLAYFQQSQDTRYNNFPSLHVALNVYAYAIIAWQWPGLGRGWLVPPVLIVLSTLLVKQHLVVDVIGGIGLAWAGYRGFRWIERQPARVVVWCFGATTAGLVLVLVTHLERIGKTWRKIGRFLEAGQIDAGMIAGATGIVLVFLLLVVPAIRRRRLRSDED